VTTARARSKGTPPIRVWTFPPLQAKRLHAELRTLTAVIHTSIQRPDSTVWAMAPR